MIGPLQSPPPGPAGLAALALSVPCHHHHDVPLPRCGVAQVRPGHSEPGSPSPGATCREVGPSLASLVLFARGGCVLPALWSAGTRRSPFGCVMPRRLPRVALGGSGTATRSGPVPRSSGPHLLAATPAGQARSGLVCVLPSARSVASAVRSGHWAPAGRLAFRPWLASGAWLCPGWWCPLLLLMTVSPGEPGKNRAEGSGQHWAVPGPLGSA